MVLEIDRKFMGKMWDTCLDAVAFSAVGYCCGRVVIEYLQQPSKLSFFYKPDLANLKSLTICCTLFICIDRLAQMVFSRLEGEREKESHAFYSCCRIGLSMVSAITLFNTLMLRTKKLPLVEFKTASAVILLAITVYSHLFLCLHFFNNRF